MSLTITRMTDEHALAIRPQAAQAIAPEDRLKVARALSAMGTTWAILDGPEVLLIGGIQPQWDGRGMAAVLIAEGVGRRMVRLTKLIRRYLDALDYRRVEMYVDAQFGDGCRWAEMLGFVNETPQGMAGFLPDGGTAFMYGRVR